MKHLCLLICIVISFTGNAQTRIANAGFWPCVFPTFTHGDMIMANPPGSNFAGITIYNSDWSIYKQVSLPTGYSYTPFISYNYAPGYNTYTNLPSLSDKLFNDDTLIEFLAIYMDQSKLFYSVFNELGQNLYTFSDTIYFDQSNYVYPQPGLIVVNGNYEFYYRDSANVYAYTLPGTLPCNQCNNLAAGLTGPPATDPISSQLMLYPNPSAGSIVINYQLPSGAATGQIEVFSLQGELIKQIPLALPNGTINDERAIPGTYLYQLSSSNGAIVKKQIVVQ